MVMDIDAKQPFIMRFLGALHLGRDRGPQRQPFANEFWWKPKESEQKRWQQQDGFNEFMTQICVWH